MGTSSYVVECATVIAMCVCVLLSPHSVVHGALHVFRVQTQVCTARLGSCGVTMSTFLTCLMTSTASLTMATVIDLATTASPYSGATVGNADATRVCGNGPEQGFSYLLVPGRGITIGQTFNNFDSMHTLRHGGRYPGEVSVGCIEDPEDESQKMEFSNEGVEDVSVYFIVDASRSGEAGAFTLEWWLYTVGHKHTETMTHHLWPEPTPGLRRIQNVYTPLTDGTIKAAAQLWVSNESSANATYGAVDTWDVSEVTSLENVWCGYDADQCGLEYEAMRKFNGDLSKWNVAKVNNMASTFEQAGKFNGDISDWNWNVSQVTTMKQSKLCGLFF
jgi:surface protein